MKASAALRDKRRERALQRALSAPMHPEWLHTLPGWNHYSHEYLVIPSLADHPALDKAERRKDPRLGFLGHLMMVESAAARTCMDDVLEAVLVNNRRREGLSDRVIDGLSGTGKSLLLRTIGRAVQLEIEEHPNFTGSQIPVVHILAPADTDNKINWIWEIACFLGLNPEPTTEDDLMRWRGYQDLSVPVNYVLETALTRLLLVDDIQRVTPAQLAPVLHYFDYLRNRLGITTVFCGTGAGGIVHEARAIADRHAIVVRQRAERLARAREQDPAHPGYTAADKEDELAYGRLPVTWLDPIPFDRHDKTSWPAGLAGYEKHLCLHNLDEKALTTHSEYLHRRTPGYFRDLSQLISQAATRAVLTGTENITLTELNAITTSRGH
ncbi:ATP-binding protein [Kitasatospora purpeofusca]|uniref:ATP-binding protein n=1 Tax=Kitasatospora purpeofusca TaxID=67352 RepID=UPI0036E329B1